MPEIRLAVYHLDDPRVLRLRGATVEPGPELARLVGHLEAPDAAVVGGAGRVVVEPLLAAGVAVLLVADPCPPADVTGRLYAAARAAGVPFALVNPDRFLPSRQLLRRQVPSTLGEPGLIRSHHWEPGPARHPDPDGLPGPLLRDLDVALWLAGRAPDRVFAVERPSDIPDQSAGRFVQVHLGFPGGGMALLDYTDRLPPSDDYRSLSVIAATGAAYADDHQNMQLAYRGGRPHAVRTEERAGLSAAIAQDFVDSLRSGRDLGATAAEWREVYAVATAVRASIATGQAVAPEAH